MPSRKLFQCYSVHKVFIAAKIGYEIFSFQLWKHVAVQHASFAAYSVNLPGDNIWNKKY